MGFTLFQYVHDRMTGREARLDEREEWLPSLPGLRKAICFTSRSGGAIGNWRGRLCVRESEIMKWYENLG